MRPPALLPLVRGLLQTQQIRLCLELLYLRLQQLFLDFELLRQSLPHFDTLCPLNQQMRTLYFQGLTRCLWDAQER